jgi:hypothetical protein
MAIKVQKLLPQAKISRISLPSSAAAVSKPTDAAAYSVKGVSKKVSVLGNIFRGILNLKSTSNKRKRIVLQRQKNKEREEKLEAKKKEPQKKDTDNLLSYVPGQSIINNLIRFGGFTLIGFFVNQVSPLMPKLIEFSNSIKPGMEAFATFTDSLVVNTIDFIDRGYKAYDTVRGLAKSIGGENFVGVFDNFSSALNIVVQGAILAGLAGAFKPRGGGRGGDIRGRSVTAVTPRGSALSEYKKLIAKGVSSDRALEQSLRNRGPGIAGGQTRNPIAYGRGYGRGNNLGLLPRKPVGLVDRFGKPLTSPSVARNMGIRGAKTAVARGASRAVPFIGPLINFAISIISGDPVDEALVGTIGAALGGFIGTAIVGAGTFGIGAVLGAGIGAMVGDIVARSLYDTAKTMFGKKQQGFNEGGQIGREIRLPQKSEQTRKEVRAPIIPQPTVIGKNVNIDFEKLYGEKGLAGLFSASQIVKGEQMFSGIFGAIGGAYIDMLMGQSPNTDLASAIGRAIGMITNEKYGKKVGVELEKSLKRTAVSIFRTLYGGAGEPVPDGTTLQTTTTSQTASGVQLDPGQPGVDFTPAGGNNRVVFPGEVVEIGHSYNPSAIGGDGRKGAGYGNFVVIRSEDPKKRGTFFDGLYAHFPDGEIKVKVGDNVTVGQNLGRMATAAEFADPATRKRVGSGTGAHTSLDFLKPGTNDAYPNYRENLVPSVDPNFSNLGNQSFLPNTNTDIASLNQETPYESGTHERNALLYQEVVVLT